MLPDLLELDVLKRRLDLAQVLLEITDRGRQLPLLDLAKETGTLCLSEMSDLYLEELKVSEKRTRSCVCCFSKRELGLTF